MAIKTCSEVGQSKTEGYATTVQTQSTLLQQIRESGDYKEWLFQVDDQPVFDVKGFGRCHFDGIIYKEGDFRLHFWAAEKPRGTAYWDYDLNDGCMYDSHGVYTTTKTVRCGVPIALLVSIIQIGLLRSGKPKQLSSVLKLYGLGSFCSKYHICEQFGSGLYLETKLEDKVRIRTGNLILQEILNKFSVPLRST